LTLSIFQIQNKIKDYVTEGGPFLKYAFQCTSFSRNSKFPILLCGKQLYRILPKSVKNDGLCGQIFMFVGKYSISVSLQTFPVLNSIKIHQNVYSLIAGHEEADGHVCTHGVPFFSLRKERLNKDSCQLTATTTG
jgi:hypothetical protein